MAQNVDGLVNRLIGMTEPPRELKFMLHRQLDKMQRDLDAMKALLKEIKWSQADGTND